MSEIILKKRYPHSREEDITDAFVRGYVKGKADRPSGKVNAVEIYEQALHDLEFGYITLGEFEERTEPLKHLYYGRPRGEWEYTNNPLRLDDEWACSRCGNISFVKTNFCDRCGARMKGADDE